MTDSMTSTASLFVSYAREAEEKRKKEKLEAEQALKRSSSEFWFMTMLLIGILLRLVGLVDFDHESAGIVSATPKDLFAAVKHVTHAMFLLSRKISPRKVFETLLAMEEEPRLVKAISSHMLSQYGEYKMEMDGVNIEELVGIIHKAKSASAVPGVKRDVVGISKPFDPAGVDLGDDEGLLLGEALADAMELSMADCVGNFSNVFVQCDCNIERYENKEYPHDGVASKLDPQGVNEMTRVVEAFKPLLRVMMKIDHCHVCSSKYTVHMPTFTRDLFLRDGAVSTMTKEVKDMIASENGFITATLTQRKVKKKVHVTVVTLRLEKVNPGAAGKHRYFRKAWEEHFYSRIPGGTPEYLDEVRKPADETGWEALISRFERHNFELGDSTVVQ